MPNRIQRKREKGWRKPRGVIDVTRSGPWGNPFRVIQDTAGWWAMVDAQHGHWFGHGGRREAMRMAVTLFRQHQLDHIRADACEHLAGRDLMCWCALCERHATGKPAGLRCDECEPCHCDILLEVANGYAHR